MYLLTDKEYEMSPELPGVKYLNGASSSQSTCSDKQYLHKLVPTSCRHLLINCRQPAMEIRKEFGKLYACPKCGFTSLFISLVRNHIMVFNCKTEKCKKINKVTVCKGGNTSNHVIQLAFCENDDVRTADSSSSLASSVVTQFHDTLTSHCTKTVPLTQAYVGVDSNQVNFIGSAGDGLQVDANRVNLLGSAVDGGHVDSNQVNLLGDAEEGVMSVQSKLNVARGTVKLEPFVEVVLVKEEFDETPATIVYTEDILSEQ